jgi:hypothetical protein
MDNIGFVETNDAQKAEVVKSILSTIKNDAKEVSKMENENTETAPMEDVAEVVTEDVEKAVEVDMEKSETEVEKAVEAEVTTEEDAEKSMHEEEDMKEKSMHEDEEEDMKEKSVKSEESEVAKALIQEVHSTFTMLADTIKALNEKVEELNKTVTGVRQDVDSVKNDFGKRVDAVEKDTAFRKSGDLGEIVQEPIFEKAQQKALWGGRFLTKSDLFA